MKTGDNEENHAIIGSLPGTCNYSNPTGRQLEPFIGRFEAIKSIE